MLTHSCPTRCAAKSSGGERFGCLDGNQSWIEASGWRHYRAGQGARNDKMAYDKSAHEELLARIAKLNTTERDCLLRVNEGKASKDIARELGLSPNYVDTCLKQAAVKLNVKGRYLAEIGRAHV